MGNDTPGAEPVSPAGSLSAAGASTLVANLWKVDDEAALLFFLIFTPDWPGATASTKLSGQASKPAGTGLPSRVIGAVFA